MNKENEKPIAQEAYNQMAKAYAELVDRKPHNAYYERPATCSLLPDPKGKRILDAGCGPGVYAELLTENGAEVVAIDANQKMVQLAKERLGDRALVILASLDQPLLFFADSSFEIVISPLVLDYIKNWRSVFEEFYRLLRSNGLLVFSIEHPYMKYDLHRDNSIYFDTKLVEYEWKGFGKRVNVPSYRRPMNEIINPLIEAGFTLDRLLEPKPTQAFKEELPEDYAKLVKEPGFMCIRAIKKVSGS